MEVGSPIQRKKLKSPAAAARLLKPIGGVSCLCGAHLEGVAHFEPEVTCTVWVELIISSSPS